MDLVVEPDEKQRQKNAEGQATHRGRAENLRADRGNRPTWQLGVAADFHLRLDRLLVDAGLLHADEDAVENARLAGDFAFQHVATGQQEAPGGEQLSGFVTARLLPLGGMTIPVFAIGGGIARGFEFGDEALLHGRLSSHRGDDLRVFRQIAPR